MTPLNSKEERVIPALKWSDVFTAKETFSQR